MFLTLFIKEHLFCELFYFIMFETGNHHETLDIFPSSVVRVGRHVLNCAR